MITLREALKLPCFEKARVVAGKSGLGHVVRRVHVIDIPDARYAWGHGALLLTAGYGLKDSPERQAALIPTLVEHGLVGMVFSLGLYFKAVPDVIRTAAEQHNFPVIEVPLEVEFINITERLYVEIVNDQFALKERAADIHRQLTRIVLDGGNLAAVAATLANILERSVLIESPTFDVLAAVQVGPVDESRLRAVEAGRTMPERAQRLLNRGVYAELQQKLKSVRLPAMPDLGMTMERVVAPIVVGREVFGYIWIVEGDHPLADLDELAIDHAATVAALLLFKEQAVREAQQAVRGDFLAQLLKPESQIDDAALEQARMVGYQISQPHQALYVVGQALAGGSAGQLSARLDNWLRKIGTWGLVVPREQGVVLIVESKSNAAGKALAERLVAELSSSIQPLVAGVGQLYPAERSMRRTYDEAVECAEIGRRFEFRSKAICFWDLGLLDWLYHLPVKVMQTNPYLGRIDVLAEHDTKTNGDLVRTLEAYLEFGGALAEAAAALNVHRNTLLYRLGRIENIAEIDLKDNNQRLNLHVALKGYRLKILCARHNGAS